MGDQKGRSMQRVNGGRWAVMSDREVVRYCAAGFMLTWLGEEMLVTVRAGKAGN